MLYLYISSNKRKHSDKFTLRYSLPVSRALNLGPVTPFRISQVGPIHRAFRHLEGTGNDLEYGKRLNTVDVLFARFVDIRTNTDAASKAEFHKLMVELREIGKRRKVPGLFPAFAKFALPSFRL